MYFLHVYGNSVTVSVRMAFVRFEWSIMCRLVVVMMSKQSISLSYFETDGTEDGGCYERMSIVYYILI